MTHLVVTSKNRLTLATLHPKDKGIKTVSCFTAFILNVFSIFAPSLKVLNYKGLYLHRKSFKKWCLKQGIGESLLQSGLTERKILQIFKRVQGHFVKEKGYTHDQLQMIGFETRHVCEKMQYETKDGRIHKLDLDDIDRMQKTTRLHFIDQLIQEFEAFNKNTFEKHETKIIVENTDTINMAKNLQEQRLDVLALNFANSKTPGGGWTNGAKAQEEDLFRRSNYFQSLDLSENHHLKEQFPGAKYDLENALIHTYNVQVFRKSEAENFEFIEPFALDFLAAAAPRLASRDTPPTKKEEEQMKKIIYAIFILGVLHKYKALVLGAFGCGVFNWNPNTVAKYFLEFSEMPAFKGRFQVLGFPVLASKNVEQAAQSSVNLKAFKKMFKGK